MENNIRKSKLHSTLRTTKMSLKSIIKKDDSNIRILSDAIDRTNQIVIHVYKFMRLFILNKYHNNIKIPIINKDFMSMTFKALITPGKAGPTPKGTNLAMLNEFKAFYESDYKDLGYTDKLDGSNLSQIFAYLEVDILTNIENNIKLNFLSYVRRFVNSSFKAQNSALLEDKSKKDKTKLREKLNKDLWEIKNDLFNNTLVCDKKYHKWINKHKHNIFPKEFKNSYEFDVQHFPQKYLKNMIYMCLELEKVDGKSFQFFPLRSSIYPKYVPLDTASLIDLFITQDKNTYFGDIDKYKKYIWEKIFNISDSNFKQKNYSFDYRIHTDGFAVSIQLISNDMIEESQKKKTHRKELKNIAKDLYKDLSQDEIEVLKVKKEMDIKENKLKESLKKKEFKDKKRAEFKRLSKEEKITEIEKIKLEKELERKTKYVQFPYLEELNETEYVKLQMENNWAVIDPGKKTLVYIQNKNGDHIKYTNKTHVSKTKRLKYQKNLQNFKNKTGISDVEDSLSSYNSKTCNYEKFKEYTKIKNLTNATLLKKYQSLVFRQYKWYGYINRKRAETDLVRDIKDKFGKDVTLIYGDWSSGQQMRHVISTPNLGLKRKLGEHFKVYNIDEFRTSCLNNKTLDKNENIYLPDKLKNLRKIHSILTYKMENNRKGCINRDNNAVRNMIKITSQFLINKERPEIFKRSYKLPIKDANLPSDKGELNKIQSLSEIYI